MRRRHAHQMTAHAMARERTTGADSDKHRSWLRRRMSHRSGTASTGRRSTWSRSLSLCIPPYTCRSCRRSGRRKRALRGRRREERRERERADDVARLPQRVARREQHEVYARVEGVLVAAVVAEPQRAVLELERAGACLEMDPLSPRWRGSALSLDFGTGRHRRSSRRRGGRQVFCAAPPFARPRGGP